MKKIWYQKGNMLAIAKALGFSASVYLFDDWIEKGLLGEASIRIWPGHGSVALWLPEQLNLFLELLVLRQRSPKNIPLGRLCPLAVGRWLYWGNLGGVNLLQVKRALTTWIDFERNIPEEQRRRDITQTMRRYEGPKATDKRLLIDELVAIWVKKKLPDRELLQVLLEPVMNAYPKRAAKDPVRGHLNLVECLSVMQSLCLPALQQEDALLDLPDSCWNWARFFTLFTYGLTFDEHAHYATDPKLGDLFKRQTVNSLCLQSCHALSTWLGLVRQKDLAPWREEPLRLFDPALWQSGVVTCSIHTDLRTSGLLLPRGLPLLYLCHRMTLAYQGESLSLPVAIPFL